MKNFSPFPPVVKTERGFDFNYLAQNHPTERKTHPKYGDVLVYKGQGFLSYYDLGGELLFLSSYDEEEGSVNGNKKIHKYYLLYFPSGEFVSNTVTCDDKKNEEVRCLEFTGTDSFEYIYSISVNKKWQIIESAGDVNQLHKRLADFVEDLNLIKN